MTPAEKTQEIMNKLSNECLIKDDKCKEAALIAVEQILELFYPIITQEQEKIFNYWYEVKTEIEKL
jgi:hypothetical protein